MNSINLNDILHLSEEQIQKTKFRFMVPSDRINFNPNLDAEDKIKQDEINLETLVYNRDKSISFEEKTIAIGFIRIRDDRWLMTGIVNVLHDNGKGNPATAEYLTQKFNFRLVVEFHKDFRNGIIRATTEKNGTRTINQLRIIELWDPHKSLGEKSFPGYKNVTISYTDLKKKLEISDEWRNALKLRKGVYLIMDKGTGKRYVGSAYGADGILGRWTTYIKSGYTKDKLENGEYPNKLLRELVQEKGMKYIEKNFQYSILETFEDDASDEFIISRESYWKDMLLSRDKKFGYNAN